MKKLLLFGIVLIAAFALGYSVARVKAMDLAATRFYAQQAKTPDLTFLPTPYPLKNRFFVIVILGRNNGANLSKTIQSAFSQNYDQVRFVYVDDGSDDGSDRLAKELIASSPHANRTTWIANDRPIGSIGSLVKAVDACQDEEIVVTLLGTDWLAHEWVLQKLNQYYADPQLWLAYCQCLDYPAMQKRSFYPYLPDQKGERQAQLDTSSLKTFYGALFKKISLSDLMYQDEYMQNSDLAYMLPMLEMAAGHFECLPDILYIANRENELQTVAHQGFFDKYVRSLDSYERLSHLFSSEEFQMEWMEVDR